MKLLQRDDFKISNVDYFNDFTAKEKIELPKGKLGIRFGKSNGDFIIVSIYDDSKLLGILKEKDIMCSLNGKDISTLSVQEVVSLFANTCQQKRTLEIRRGIDNFNDSII